MTQNMILNVDKNITPDELTKISNYLNCHFVDKSLAEIRNNLCSEISKEQGEIRALIEKTQMLSNALFDSPAFEEEFILGYSVEYYNRKI